MTRDDIRKLLGGYSTGTLTPEEERALFAAALEDQELFDALAKEQALRDLLRDPAAMVAMAAVAGRRGRHRRVPGRGGGIRDLACAPDPAAGVGGRQSRGQSSARAGRAARRRAGRRGRYRAA
jgi:hypothetical protein